MSGDINVTKKVYAVKLRTWDSIFIGHISIYLSFIDLFFIAKLVYLVETYISNSTNNFSIFVGDFM